MILRKRFHLVVVMTSSSTDHMCCFARCRHVRPRLFHATCYSESLAGWQRWLIYKEKQQRNRTCTCSRLCLHRCWFVAEHEYVPVVSCDGPHEFSTSARGAQAPKSDWRRRMIITARVPCGFLVTRVVGVPLRDLLPVLGPLRASSCWL